MLTDDMRLNPNRGEYNLYIYPYKRDWLDHHLQQAERGIRFITSDYKELFKIVDGESVQIKYSDGKSRKVPCRYIDDYHLEFGAELYHICQLAELLEKNGHSVQKLSNEKSKEKNANLER